MSEIGKVERETQNRVIQLFHNDLGYEYLGNWEDREGNSNIEEALLTEFLVQSGYSTDQIKRTLDVLRRKPIIHPEPSMPTTKPSTASFGMESTCKLVPARSTKKSG